MLLVDATVIVAATARSERRCLVWERHLTCHHMTHAAAAAAARYRSRGYTGWGGHSYTGWGPAASHACAATCLVGHEGRRLLLALWLLWLLLLLVDGLKLRRCSSLDETGPWVLYH